MVQRLVRIDLFDLVAARRRVNEWYARMTSRLPMPAPYRLRAPKAASPRPPRMHSAGSQSGGRCDLAYMSIVAHIGERGIGRSHHR